MSDGSSERPLVSCILPTYDRRGFLPHAIHYFLRQDYPDAELLIVDDGTDPVGDIVIQHPRIRYLRLSGKITLGAKLNLACAQVSGSIIAQWDDDDWYAPSRLTRQVDALLRTGSQVSGVNDLMYYDIRAGQGYRYVYPREERPWLLGSSLCFRRELWEQLRFADIDVGMDGLFVWATPPHLVCALPDSSFAVHLIHQRNVSPKSPSGSWWSNFPVSEIARTMGDDWRYYEPRGEPITCPRPRPLHVEPRLVVDADPALDGLVPSPDAAVKRARNVYACLVHESRDCVFDLARNLHCLDPESTILLYNGGDDPHLLADDGSFKELGVIVHPRPRPMRWGRLHEFARDCMRFALDSLPFDTMTMVDSDQLALRAGWSDRLASHLGEQGSDIGLLGIGRERQAPGSGVAAANTAWQEIELWRPFLRRFRDGEDKFVQWTSWPSTVFVADAVRELVRLLEADAELCDILKRTRCWVTEEILFPTLTALLGFRVLSGPGSYDYLKRGVPYSASDIEAALYRSDVYWIHPIPRQLADPRRTEIRQRLGHYQALTKSVSSIAPNAPDAPTLESRARASSATPELRRTSVSEEIRGAILSQMRPIRGWLQDVEADLLMTAAAEALMGDSGSDALVEVGSFCGKATTVLASVVRALRPTARIWAVDPHDGVVGAVGQSLANEGPTLESFVGNIESAGLSAFVEPIQSKAPDVAWARPVCLLLVDGLHDRENVSRDFGHFESHLADAGFAVFHDYTPAFPGVMSFVDELLSSGRYAIAGKAASLMVLRKQCSSAETTPMAAAQVELAV